MITAIGRIAAAVDLPVTADLEAGYGDAGTTVRRAIGAGVVGGNIEDQMRPLASAVAAVSAAVRAGEAAGVPFVLNARTDAFLLAADRDPEAVLADAVERGRAFLDAGASCVFVPGRLAPARDLTDGSGRRPRDHPAGVMPDGTGLATIGNQWPAPVAAVAGKPALRPLAARGAGP
jgi:2-methylisocitrate lyase-like PEP mutase family enzyme